MLSQFFQTLPLPANQLYGSYSIRLVILSFLVATAASYVALDITSRLKDVSISKLGSYIWLIGGSLAMGAGIWSMHFIGMLAFIMPMPMMYDPIYTGLSMIVAVIASGLAFALLRSKTIKLSYLILGGIILGFAIAAMHYIGMAAMMHMQIHYLPSIFTLSIIVAIVASEAALYLALKSAQPTQKHRFVLKICSAFVMGAAICGMHYTGMAAAVFTPSPTMPNMEMAGTNPDSLAAMIAIVTILILGIAISVSSFKEALSLKTVALARQSGMAEVASSVLHNVGNVLNSVNVSSSLISGYLKKIDLGKLTDINQLIEEHKEDLGAFISTDPRGLRLPRYLAQLTSNWQQEYQSLTTELGRLDQNIQYIKEIISLQQNFSGIMNFAELVSIDKLLDEALILASIDFTRHNITIIKDYAKLKPTYVDQFKLTQIVINLIRNAKEALLDSKNAERIIKLKTGSLNNEMFFIEVSDNGIGINPADQSRIFTYGFTTKKTGHGFGLHSSIISTQEMNGLLTAYSEGKDKGATFTLKLPYQKTK